MYIDKKIASQVKLNLHQTETTIQLLQCLLHYILIFDHNFPIHNILVLGPNMQGLTRSREYCPYSNVVYFALLYCGTT
jgi:hypothetical protein